MFRNHEALNRASAIALVFSLGLTACTSNDTYDTSTETIAESHDNELGSANAQNLEYLSPADEQAVLRELLIARQKAYEAQQQKFEDLEIPKQNIIGFWAEDANINEGQTVDYFPWRQHREGDYINLNPARYDIPYALAEDLPLDLDGVSGADIEYGSISKAGGEVLVNQDLLIIGHTDSLNGGIMDDYTNMQIGSKQTIVLDDGTKIITEVVEVSKHEKEADLNKHRQFLAKGGVVGVACVIENGVFIPDKAFFTRSKIVSITTAGGEEFDLKYLQFYPEPK